MLAVYFCIFVLSFWGLWKIARIAGALLGVSLCILLLGAAFCPDSMVIFEIGVFCLVAGVVLLCWPSKQANSEDFRESIRKSNRREKKIEEQYGIIDFTDRK